MTDMPGLGEYRLPGVRAAVEMIDTADGDQMLAPVVLCDSGGGPPLCLAILDSGEIYWDTRIAYALLFARAPAMADELDTLRARVREFEAEIQRLRDLVDQSDKRPDGEFSE